MSMFNMAGSVMSVRACLRSVENGRLLVLLKEKEFGPRFFINSNKYCAQQTNQQVALANVLTAWPVSHLLYPEEGIQGLFVRMITKYGRDCLLA